MTKTATHAFITKLLLFGLVLLLAFVHVYAQAPLINSFSPASGPVGTAVIITGTGFNATAANNIVFFGATRATVTAASPVSITVAVPTGATYQPISVLNITTGLTGYSDQPFVTTFTPNQEAITAADFMPPVIFTTGSSGSSVCVGDIDGDGKPDLVLFSADKNTFSVLRNTSVPGSITPASFAAHVDFATGNVPESLAVGDLDGDGRPDVAVVNSADSTVSVYRNTSTAGAISFAPVVTFAVRSGSGEVVIGDMDGDGKPDLIIVSAVYTNGQNTNTYVTTISVFRNTSTKGSINNGSFAPGVVIASTAGNDEQDLVIGDIDGDGKPDIVESFYITGEVLILRNTSTAGVINGSSFAAPLFLSTRGIQPTYVFPFSVSIGDIDGDGKPDLVVVNSDSEYDNLCIFRNTSTIGTVSFAPQVDFLTRNGFPTFAAIGDLDGDGKPDIALVNQDQDSIEVFRNTSTVGSITPNSLASGISFAMGLNPEYGNVAIADLDGDGKPDLVAAIGSYQGESVVVLRNAPILPLSKIATLNNLTISNGTLTPAFAVSTVSYSDSVANTVTGVTVTPTVTDTTARVTVNGVPVTSGTASGLIPLAVGPNTITVLVTARDGVTTDTYTITVVRAASPDATLLNLTVSQGTLAPVFNSSTTAYTDSVSYLVTNITVTPTINNSYATITINGVVVASGTASNAIPLTVGENTITVIVTAQDGVTTDTYTISVYRGEAISGIYVPNAFTPNGDGKNDQVHVHGENIKSMKFYVYDQWGALLFTSISQQNGWDGTYKGTKEPVGVYVYYVQAIMNDGQTVNKKGTITLIR